MSIFFATPCYGGQVTSGFFQSALRLKKELTLNNVNHDWGILWNDSLVTRARNTLVSQFLETEFEYLFFIDADIQFEPEAVATLWNESQTSDYQILTGSYPLKRKEGGLSAWVGDEQLQESIETEVTYAGTGFMMIHRNVIKEIIRKLPHIEYEENGKKFAVFDTMLDQHRDGKNTYLSEDYTFCKRATTLGYRIINLDVKLKHWGTFVYE